MDWYIAPPVAWSLVIGVVGLASALLSFLHHLTREDSNQPPSSHEPTDYRQAA